MSTVCSSTVGGGQLNRNRSWPFWAEISAEARALRPAMPMLSTVTSVSFLSPHSLAYFLLNHSSYAGTKWTHWRIRSFFRAAFARPGIPMLAPRVAAVLRKRRRFTLRWSLICVSLRWANSRARFCMCQAAWGAGDAPALCYSFVLHGRPATVFRRHPAGRGIRVAGPHGHRGRHRDLRGALRRLQRPAHRRRAHEALDLRRADRARAPRPGHPGGSLHPGDAGVRDARVRGAPLEVQGAHQDRRHDQAACESDREEGDREARPRPDHARAHRAEPA